MQDPNTLVDPSEAPPLPVPIHADTQTPFPGELPMPNFGAAAVSAAPAVEKASVVHSADLTFELPELPPQERSSVSGDRLPRPPITTTPLPSPAKTRRATNRDAQGMVMLNPTGLFSVDMTAELTAAISMRMKPPPQQSVDRRLIIGTWAFGTLAAFGLWILGLFYNPECLPFVALLGGSMLLVGLCWRAYLVSQDESLLRGLLCLLPPFSLLWLFQKAGENGHRPLRFAASGAAVLALLATSATARSLLEPGSAKMGTHESLSNPERLRAAKDQPAKLLDLLKELGNAETARAAIGDEKVATALEIAALLKHDQLAVRIAAGQALVEWSPSEAHKWVLAALHEKEGIACQAALEVAGKLPDAEIVAAVAAKLSDRDHRLAAGRCLLTLGKSAEKAVIDQLDAGSEVTQLAAIDLLGQIGGAKSFTALHRLATKTKSESVKAEAAHAAERVAASLEKQ